MSEAKNEQKGWYDAIKPLKTTFANGGTHVNVSAAALAKNAPNKDNGVKLIEFMLGEKAQELYANGNFEFPVNPAVKDSAAGKLLGNVVPDTISLSDVAKNRKAAADLVDKVGFDNGSAAHPRSPSDGRHSRGGRRRVSPMRRWPRRSWWRPRLSR